MRSKVLFWSFTCVLIISFLQASGQPYFEPVSISGAYFPKGDPQPAQGEKVFFLNLAVPLKLAEGTLLVFSPFQEYRNSNRAEDVWFPDFLSTAIPVSLLKYLNDSVWLLNVTVINRWNQTETEYQKQTWQFGGAVINTIKVDESLKLKFGIYFNREFFSEFFVPLAGLEWRICENLQLFGTLPNNMKMEYRLNPNLYAGAVFRSITNSYRNLNEQGGYYKHTDNQTGIFADVLLTGKLVMTLEAGHTLLKTTKSRVPDAFYERKTDSFYLRAGFSYRIRFDS